MKFDFGQAVSEMFKECGQQADRLTTEAYLSYKITNEPLTQVSLFFFF